MKEALWLTQLTMSDESRCLVQMSHADRVPLISLVSRLTGWIIRAGVGTRISGPASRHQRFLAKKFAPSLFFIGGRSMSIVDSAPQAANTSVAPPDPFDPCFLTAQTLDEYIAFISKSQDDPISMSGDDPRFALFARVPDWSEGKDRFPLPLCEFLAYQSVLAYEKSTTIDEHLKGFRIKTSDYRFFDSSVREDWFRPVGDTQGFGVVIGDTAFIIMRGSASLIDWVNNFTARPTHKGLWKRTLDVVGDPDPARHLGFARAWGAVVPKIERWVKELRPQVRHFCFSGHSQGGALAILGAYDFARRGIGEVAAVVTFAAPKVGGRDFAEHYDSPKLRLGPRTLRLESVDDAVPRVGFLGGRPVGAVWPIKKRPMIAGWEAFWAGLFGIAGWKRAEAPSAPQAEANKPQAEANKKPEAGTDGPASSTNAGDKASKPATEDDSRKGLAIIIGIAIAIVVAILARRIIIRYRAHGAAKRYALYLTTLSYGQIRGLRISQAASDENYKRASEELDKHLDYVRGKDPDHKIYKDLRKRPIRALTVLRAKGLNDSTVDGAGYARYIW